MLETSWANVPIYVPGSIKLVDAEVLQGSWELPYLPEKRSIFYENIGCVMEIVGYEKSDQFMKWINENRPDPTLPPQEMTIKLFVQYFNIPKQRFVEAIEKKRARCLANEEEVDTNEENELPNADIIYTFDNDIINEYYRRE